MPEAVADEVFRRLNYADHGEHSAGEAQSYDTDSAGSIMSPAVIKVSQGATVSEALAAIREAGVDEDFYAVFVVDEQGKYVGNLHVRLLLTRPEQTRVESLVDRDSLFVHTDTNREEVRNLFTAHNLSAVPVLDRDGQLVGRVVRNGE